MKIPYLLLIILIVFITPAYGQLMADTLFSWQGYNKESVCALQLYFNPTDARRSHTVILKELAENTGASAIDDAGYLAEHVARFYGFDPTKAYWIFHWGTFSYSGAEPAKKELFIRATFNRTSTNRLGSANWRIVKIEDVELYTDRHFRR